MNKHKDKRNYELWDKCTRVKEELETAIENIDMALDNLDDDNLEEAASDIENALDYADNSLARELKDEIQDAIDEDSKEEK